MSLHQRFTLSNQALGDLLITNPGGWKEAQFTTERGENHEFNLDYTTDLRFSGNGPNGDGGKDFILKAKNEQGLNVEVILIYEVSTDNKKTWKEQYRGMLFLEDYNHRTEKANFIEVPINRISFKSTFGERKKIKINLNDRIGLDEGNVRNYQTNDIDNKGRTLEQVFDAEYSNDDPSFNQAVQGFQSELAYYNIGYEKINRDDLQSFSFTSLNDIDPISLFLSKSDGDFNVIASYDADLRIRTPSIPKKAEQFRLATVYRIDEGEEVILKEEFFNETNNDFTKTVNFSQTFNVSINKGQKLYFYGIMEVFPPEAAAAAAVYQVIIASGSINVSGLTTFRPTITKTYTVHDAFSILCESITGRQNSFYSEYLGNRKTQFQSYSENGEWSFLSVGSGYNLREIEKDYSISWNKLYNSVNSLTPLCISFETINNEPVVRVEHVSYAYNNEIVASFDAKYINEAVDKQAYFNSIISGYDKWEAENVNGLNEPNGVREYSTTLRTVGKEYKIKSEIIASSQMMEVTRRKADEKTTDYQFDKDIFFFALKRTTNVLGDPIGLKELENNENYTLVTGILQPSDIVNLRLSPVMNVLRHGVVVNSGLLKYPGTPYKLTASEGNDQMTTQTAQDFEGNFNGQVLAENQDIIWSYAERTETIPLFSGDLLPVRIPMSFTEFANLKDEVNRDENGKLNKHKAIEVTAKGVTKRGWILEMEYNQSTEPVAIITLREANGEIFGITPQTSTKLAFEDGSFVLLSDNRFLNI